MIITMLLIQAGLGRAALDWSKCLDQAAAQYATVSKESAPDIASASFGKCAAKEQAVRDDEAYRLQDIGGTWADLDRLMLRVKQMQRDRLIALVIEARSK